MNAAATSLAADRPEPVRAERRVLWLASYPKSGNTWFRKIWKGFAGDRGDSLSPRYGQLSSRRLFEDVTGLSARDLSTAELHAATPRVWSKIAAGPGPVSLVKAHDAFYSPVTGAPLFEASISLGAVYLVRNPLDVAVSFAFFAAREGAPPNFDQAVRTLNDQGRWMGRYGRAKLSPQFLSDWSNHVRGWMEQDVIPLALVRYEDMLDDAGGVFARTLETFGISGAGDGARIEAAVDAARFERLQAEEDEAGFPEKPEGAERFFREGKAGGWRTHLTTEQARSIVGAHGPMMTRLGYDTEI